MSDRRTTFARAAAGYDEAFERQLVEVITKAIFEESVASDIEIVALRPAETCEALLVVLSAMLAMSPPTVRTPAAIRKTTNDMRRKLTSIVREAEQNVGLQTFRLRSYGDPGGCA